MMMRNFILILLLSNVAFAKTTARKPAAEAKSVKTVKPQTVKAQPVKSQSAKPQPPLRPTPVPAPQSPLEPFREPGDFEMSAFIGSMGSISGKLWVYDQAALDLGIEYLDERWSVLYTDVYWHFPRLFGMRNRFTRETALYVGGGGGVGFWTRRDRCGRWKCNWREGSTGTGTGFIVRGVVGLEWYPPRSRFSVFGEVIPSTLLFPNGNTVDVGVGARFSF